MADILEPRESVCQGWKPPKGPQKSGQKAQFSFSWLRLIETRFLCITRLGCPGTCFVDQVGLALKEIHLPLAPGCRD